MVGEFPNLKPTKTFITSLDVGPTVAMSHPVAVEGDIEAKAEEEEEAPMGLVIGSTPLDPSTSRTCPL